MANEALALAKSAGDEAVMVRVLNHVCEPLRVPPLHEQSLTTDEQCPRPPGPAACRLVLFFFAAYWRRQVAAGAGSMRIR